MSIRVVQRREMPVADIVVQKESCHLRSHVNKEGLAGLARNIAAEGLLEDILVTGDDQPKLVCGYRRYLACKMAGLTQVPVTVVQLDDEFDWRMVELSENLCREDLDDVDLAVGFLEMKRLYEEKHPETKHGGERSKLRNSEVACFVDYISKLLGCGTTKVHDLLTRAQAYCKHPDWAKAVREDQMTPSSVMNLWRHENRHSGERQARGRHSAFRIHALPGDQGQLLHLVVVPGDGDPKKAETMEKAIAAWWKTTSLGKVNDQPGHETRQVDVGEPGSKSSTARSSGVAPKHSEASVGSSVA
jgi:hypothetical protein